MFGIDQHDFNWLIEQIHNACAMFVVKEKKHHMLLVNVIGQECLPHDEEPIKFY